MRRDCDWFARRAALTWRSVPGRSMLLLIPAGCNETEAAQLAATWVEANFVSPEAYRDHKPLPIAITADALNNSGELAVLLAKRVSRETGIKVDIEDIATETLRAAVETCLVHGIMPILILQRFHAFAHLKDGGMTSMLSAMRELERGGELTTLALSPLGYDSIRGLMEAELPFLNSVYGDNHDVAVMSVLGRQEFVDAAQARGIDQATAQRMFALAGGPDAVHEALLDAALLPPEQWSPSTMSRAGKAIDQFLERSVPIAADQRRELLGTLALGRMTPAQEAFVLGNPLHPFLSRTGARGGLICSSPIVARRILQAGMPVWGAYGECLTALEQSDYKRAAALAGSLSDDHPRLALFRGLVTLEAALHSEPDRGLLGVDWKAADTALKLLSAIDPACRLPFEPWLEQVRRWTAGVKEAAGFDRPQADRLAARASSPEQRGALRHMVSGAVRRAGRLTEPAAQVNALVNLPETMLQAFAVAYCALDFEKAPAALREAPYQQFFSGKTEFVPPNEGQKMALSTLLTVVPAIIAIDQPDTKLSLTDDAWIRPLHGKLVKMVRNPRAHTEVAFGARDADLLQEVCERFYADWAILSAGAGERSPIEQPSMEDLGLLLMGSEQVSAAA